MTIKYTSILYIYIYGFITNIDWFALFFIDYGKFGQQPPHFTAESSRKSDIDTYHFHLNLFIVTIWLDND